MEYLTDNREKMTTYELSCLYWVYHVFDSHWNQEIVQIMEQILCQNITREILLQKQLDKEKDDKTDLALQSIRISDLKTIMQLYELDATLRGEASVRYKEITKLIK